MNSSDWKPTTRLRFVEREGEPVLGEDEKLRATVRYVLQQWHAPDLPAYMRGAEGEWRDVPVKSE